MNLFHTTYNSSTKVWSGPLLPPIYHPDVNAAQVLLDAMNRDPEAIGQISVNNGLKLTNRELVLNTIRLAQNMEKLGIRSGDVVAVLALNHHHVYSVLIASFALAAPVHALGVTFSKGKLLYYILIL